MFCFLCIIELFAAYFLFELGFSLFFGDVLQNLTNSTIVKTWTETEKKMY